MSKNRLNLVVDTLAYLAMVALASTGLMMAYVLPPGTGGRHSGEPARTLLGLGRHDWGDLHFYVAIALLVLMLLHVILHWKWITNTFGALLRPRPVKPGAGLGGAALLLALGALTAAALAAPWLIPTDTQPSGGKGHGHGKGAHSSGAGCQTCTACPSAEESDRQHGEHGAGAAAKGQGSGHEHGTGEGHAIRGRTTLAEAAQAAGVSVESLCQELKIPADTDPATGLGHIRRGAGLSMQDIRAAIERLQPGPKPK
jgi:hypothetical protein